MMEHSDSLGLTAAGNRRHPKLSDVVNWLDEAWKGLSMEGVKKKAKELGMTADPGPVVKGFVDKVADDLYNVAEDGNLIEPEAEEEALIVDINLEDDQEIFEEDEL